MNGWLQSTETAWRLAGWTMLHFLWIGAIVALAGGAIRVACRRAAPGVRYALSLTTLAALFLTPVVIAAALSQRPAHVASSTQPRKFAEGIEQPRTLPGDSGWNEPTSKESSAQGPRLREGSPLIIDLAQETRAATLAGPVSEATAKIANSTPNRIPNPTPPRSGEVARPNSMASSFQGSGISVDAVIRQLPWIWIVGAPVTFALLAAGLVGSRRLQRHCEATAAGPIHDALHRLRAAMRVARRVTVAMCDGVAQPVLVGIVRPVILLPAAAASGWTPEELEMVLVHELAHVRRWDNLVNLTQRVVESLLFFHPAVWMASRQVRRDREECCDAAVVAHTRRPDEYASLLVSIATALRHRRRPALAAASAMADHPLAGRIRRILNLEDEPMWVSRKTLAGLILSALAIVAAALFIPPAVLADDEPATATEPSTGATADPAGNGAPVSPLELPATKEILSPVPEKVLGSPAARERVVKELARQGFKAVIPVVEGDPDAKVAMTITVPADFKARVVWEEGSDGHVCRVIDLGKPAPADETAKAYGSASEPPRFAGVLKRAEPGNDAVITKVYPVAEVDDVKLQQWMAIISSDKRIEVQWFDKNKSLVVTAPESGHERISKFLQESRDAADVEAEAQEFRFAADVDASEINERAKALAAAGKQVKIKRNADGSATVIAVREIPPTPDEHRLKAGDMVKVAVAGVIPEQPINDAYAIEPQGTLALGPTYGRVNVAGMTVLQAEEAVKTHLEAILTNVQVQITLIDHQPQTTGPPATAAAAGSGGAPSYLYDGKSLNQWRDLWKYELKTERRIDALLALAAFGSRQHGREAAAAILEISIEYPAGNPLEDGVRGAFGVLSEKHWTGEIIAAESWLPVLMERLKDDPAKWSPLAARLMDGLYNASAETRKLLMSIAADPAYGPNAPALGALLRTTGNEDAELRRLVKEVLTGPDHANAVRTLHYLGYTRTDEFLEQETLLFHEDAATRRGARTVLAQPRRGKDVAGIADRLIAVLDDPARPEDHANAIRALAALVSKRTSDAVRAQTAPGAGRASDIDQAVIDKIYLRIEPIARAGPRELLALSRLALFKLKQTEANLQHKELDSEATPEERAAIDKAAVEEEEQLVDPAPAPGLIRGGEGFSR